MKPRISMITLGVRDLAIAVRFYEDGLGFPRMESPPEVAFFTLDGTWLTREEAIKGSIEVGKLADMAVLDRDYFSVPDEEIKDIQVDTTIVGGQVVWRRE